MNRYWDSLLCLQHFDAASQWDAAHCFHSLCPLVNYSWRNSGWLLALCVIHLPEKWFQKGKSLFLDLKLVLLFFSVHLLRIYIRLCIKALSVCSFQCTISPMPEIQILYKNNIILFYCFVFPETIWYLVSFISSSRCVQSNKMVIDLVEFNNDSFHESVKTRVPILGQYYTLGSDSKRNFWTCFQGCVFISIFEISPISPFCVKS